MKDLAPILAFFSFWLGACIASFLNVVIWRAPRGESIVSPPSHCPKCNSPIKWYQNIPILSWLALRGKCANCKAPISPRYIFVETLGGCLFLAAFLWLWLPTAPLWFAVTHVVVMWIWIALMIAGAFIDFDHQLLPDFTTVGGMVLGVAESLVATSFNFVYGDGVQASTWLKFTPLFWSLGGLVFGFGLLWLVRWIGSKAFKREAMGMGDVFLMGAVGALFGPVAVLVTLILSSVFGSIVGVVLILLSKTKLGGFTPIPYGPYICMGCLAWMFYGPQLVNCYLHLFAP
ncbi:MAG: prepilin peptidase [Kiritimatiellae bacterium]|nr:prepilin peptidase [Kiritimatiellia bacterium]